MGVLAAILTNARWIPLDVARLLNGPVERRREETQQFAFVIQQVLFERSHRLFGTFRIGNAGQHAPRLCDGIDLAFVTVLRAKRCAVVVETTAIPLAIPTIAVERFGQAFQMRFPDIDTLLVLARFSNRDEFTERIGEEPAKPNALALSLHADEIHAVVPVAAEDQRQTVLAGSLDSKVERQGAMLIKACRLFGDFRLIEGIVFALLQLAPFEEWQLFIEDRAVARRLDIKRSAIAEPDNIVRDQRADARPGRWQPPMLDIAFRELA